MGNRRGDYKKTSISCDPTFQTALSTKYITKKKLTKRELCLDNTSIIENKTQEINPKWQRDVLSIIHCRSLALADKKEYGRKRINYVFIKEIWMSKHFITSLEFRFSEFMVEYSIDMFDPN